MGSLRRLLIRNISDIPPNWKDIRNNADKNELDEIPATNDKIISKKEYRSCMNKIEVEWKNLFLYSYSYFLAIIAFFIMIAIPYSLVYFIGEVLSIYDVIITSAIGIFLAFFLVGYLVRIFTPKSFAITSSSLLLKYRNRDEDYKWTDIKKLKYSKPWNIEIHLKNGKRDGLLISSEQIEYILTEAKKHNVKILERI